MRTVSQFGRGVKVRRAKVEEFFGKSLDQYGMDTRLQLIQELIPLGLLHVEEVLRQEVEALASQRYSPQRRGSTWSCKMDQAVGFCIFSGSEGANRVSAVRDVKEGREVEVTRYKRLQEPRRVDDGLLKKILLGLLRCGGCRRYRECSEAIPEVFGLAPSTVS